ncbi:MAG TPA: hypothetical protein VFQ53_22995 [Kofleriaceae bacterium]|nr:hypothetical protein [Kofleriaceae bacterium]
MGLRGVICCLVLVGCGSVTDDTPRDAPAGGDGSGSGSDGPPGARCDPTKTFGTPTLVEAVNSSNDETAFSLTRDEQTAFVGRVFQPPISTAQIFVSHRGNDGKFAAPTMDETSSLNGTGGDEYSPSPVADGLTLYFHRQDTAQIAIHAASRTDATATFAVDSVVTAGTSGIVNALSPTISDDGQTLYWLDFGDFKLRSATRGGTPTIFNPPTLASTVDMGAAPVLTSDELTMFYTQGNATDILVSTRATKTDAFGIGIPVENVNSAAQDMPVWLTRDGCVLYLASTRSGGLGGFDLWEAHRPQ